MREDVKVCIAIEHKRANLYVACQWGVYMDFFVCTAYMQLGCRCVYLWWLCMFLSSSYATTKLHNSDECCCIGPLLNTQLNSRNFIVGISQLDFNQKNFTHTDLQNNSSKNSGQVLCLVLSFYHFFSLDCKYTFLCSAAEKQLCMWCLIQLDAISDYATENVVEIMQLACQKPVLNSS